MSDTIFIGLVDPLLQKVDFKNLSAVEWLDTEPDSMERNVLKYQIERYKDILN